MNKMTESAIIVKSSISSEQKNKSGITLIVLIITIIVLLILAGVAIATVVGNGGMLSKSKKSVSAYTQEQAKEKLQIHLYEIRMDIIKTRDTTVKDCLLLKEKEGIEKIEFISQRTASATIVGEEIENPKYAIVTCYSFSFMVNSKLMIISGGIGENLSEEEPTPTPQPTPTPIPTPIPTPTPQPTPIPTPNLASGLYYGNNFTSWADLKTAGRLSITDGVITKFEPNSADYFNQTKGVLVIDSEITGIGDYAFCRCVGLTQITLPNTLTSIGNCAFECCRALTSVVIPRSVTTIGYGPYNQCSAIETITVDSNNTIFDSRNNCNGIVRKSDNSFIAGCKNSVIPDGIVTIGRATFNGCTPLTSITIPSTVTTIEWDAFQGCSGLTSITIPAGVTTIGNTAFNECTGLTSLTVPNGVTSIGFWSFHNVAHIYYNGSASGSPWGAKAIN